RVNRGGSFLMNAAEPGRSYTRGVDKPTETQPDLGFRCALDLPAAPPASKRTP
ncbi:MAG: hypothetical protein HY744_18425, partial [Deltaproteobacteria bacterium]|nr:hypothetical protein [Deltaproteobacteria bacterium]